MNVHKHYSICQLPLSSAAIYGWSQFRLIIRWQTMAIVIRQIWDDGSGDGNTKKNPIAGTSNADPDFAAAFRSCASVLKFLGTDPDLASSTSFLLFLFRCR